jgi:prevent-host-death family protein
VKSTWQLQEAKNRLSELVEEAIHQGHQTITRHGEPAVVVAFRDFQRWRGRQHSLVEFLCHFAGENHPPVCGSKSPALEALVSYQV